MRDSHGRNIDYIRISVTDRCNLRCVYCMPEQEECTAVRQQISGDDLIVLCECFAQLGIKNIKITGGEPLVRRDVPELIRRMKAIPGIESITLTTNGVLLKPQLPALVKAGLDAVNISLDSLDEEDYARISRRRTLSGALSGLDAACAYPDLLVKVNCVPIRGMNDEQLGAIAGLARDRNVHVRFIEMMPIGYGRRFAFQGEEEIRSRLEQELGKKLIPYEGKIGHGPSHYYAVEGFRGKIGFISAISHKFCEDCNRVRLTCDGFLKTCLQYNIGCDLRSLMEKGLSKEQIRSAIRETIYSKPLCHHFENPEEENREEGNMSQIGG